MSSKGKRLMRSGFRASVGARLLLAVCLIAIVASPLGSSSVTAASALHRISASGSATGGKRITVRVELNGPAPAGGALVLVDLQQSADSRADFSSLLGRQDGAYIGITHGTDLDRHVR